MGNPHIGFTKMRYPGNEPEDGPAKLMRWEGDNIGWVPVIGYRKIARGRKLVAAYEEMTGRKLTHNRVDFLCDNTDWDYDICEEVIRMFTCTPICSTTYVLESGRSKLFQDVGADCVLIEYGGPERGPSDSEMLIFL